MKKIPKINFIHFGRARTDIGLSKIPFDPSEQYAVIRCSICTGEKVAGFRNYKDGHFTEVMLIRNAEDEESFREFYHLETVKTEY